MSSTDGAWPGEISAGAYEDAQAGADFQDLRRRYRGFSFPMTVAFLSWYAVFVGLSVFAPDVMGTPVFGNINVGLLIGLGQFASTALITWLYIRHSTRRLDPLADEIREKLEAEA